MVELTRCPSCGHYNPSGRDKCFLCEGDLSGVSAAPSRKKRKAPAAAKKKAGAKPKAGKGRRPWIATLVVVAVLALIALAVFIFVPWGDGEGGGIGPFLGPSDTEAPKMVSINPVDGAVVAPGPMMVRGMASEEVARASIQGKEATVTGSGFAAEVEVPEGPVVLEIELEDRAGNVSTSRVEYRGMTVPEGLVLLEVDPTFGPVFQSVKAPRVELARLEGGTFSMGSSDGDADEKVIHEVTFSPYLLARTETTNAAYARYVEEAGARKPRNPQWAPDYFTSHPDHPVVNVSWDEAKAFCEWAGLRLPTEAEWEFAALSDTGGTYPWGNEAPGEGGTWRAVHDAKDDGYLQDAPTASLPAGDSPFGLSDMAGNVWEWTADGYRPYSSEAQTDPEPVSGSEKVLRGGSWTSSADAIRSANRYKLPANTRRHNIGFRCAAGLK